MEWNERKMKTRSKIIRKTRRKIIRKRRGGKEMEKDEVETRK